MTVSLLTIFSRLLVCLLLGGLSSLAWAQEAWGPWSRAMALGSEPKYQQGFKQFEYVSDKARQGGELRLAAMGSFDKLNPFTLKGLPARGLMELVFEPLATGSLDEPMSMYGLLASEMRLATNGLAIEFRIDPQARFSNGKPVTAQDVQFSFDTLRSGAASPIWKNYWSDVRSIVVVDDRTVRFEFARRNRELHMIVASLPVFSRDWVPAGKTFAQVVQESPIGSGPYVVEQVDLGRRVTYRRQEAYWAAKKPSRAGQFNFDRISFHYYKDVFARLEALKAGEFDFIHENTAKNWARSYTGRAFESGRLIRAELPNQNAAGLQGFFFNIRRPIFKDVRVRQAIALAMDFEWMNRQLFYNQYQRSNSYFTNSEMAAKGLPSAAEVSLLKSLAAKADRPLAPEWLQAVPEPASTKAPASLRDNLRKAKTLLEEAGYRLVDGRLLNQQGQPLAFEILISQKSWERVIAPFTRNLQKLGVVVSTRVTDASLYKKRVDDYDYDMLVHWYQASQNPGNELLFRFTSQSAKELGADNFIGVADPVVDAAISAVLSARGRSELVLAARVLDRLLRHGHYAIAHWHNNVHRVAYARGLVGPAKRPHYYHSEDWAMATWWWAEAQGNR